MNKAQSNKLQYIWIHNTSHDLPVVTRLKVQAGLSEKNVSGYNNRHITWYVTIYLSKQHLNICVSCHDL